MHAVLGEQEDKVSSSTVAQQIAVLEEKLGEIAAHLRTKNDLKK